MNADVLNLLFPQWQGSGKSKELLFGAKKIQESLRGEIDFTEVSVSTEEDNVTQNGIYAYSSILAQLKNVCKIIEAAKPKKIMTIGGDCGVELAPVSYLNRQYSNDLAVIWFDAHGDLNTPEDSLSHHFHGMPLRSLLGEGNEEIIQSSFSNISPNQVALVGGRDFDEAEQEFLTNKEISNYSVPQITMEPESLIQAIHDKGLNNLYIHIDLDVLDPQSFPYVKCPTKNGLTFETLIKTIAALNNEFAFVGISIVEFSPMNDSGMDYIKKLMQINRCL